MLDPESDARRLAYHLTPGSGPTILFLPGYASDMSGGKALAVETWAKASGRACLRFDYAGCGQSAGAFEDQSLALWRDDALAMIDEVIEGPVVLVGSSMGGWIALMVARDRAERIAAMVLIAPAPDFTDWGFTSDEKMTLLSEGRIERLSPYSPEPTVYTRRFWASGEANRIAFGTIPIDCPVRIMHGQRDSDVPWERSVHLAGLLRSADVQTVLVKDGDHRLSREPDIDLLLRTLERIPSPMILPLMLALQAGPPADSDRYERCIDLAVSDPDRGAAEAVQWRLAGGGYLAQQCIGMAYATQKRWPSAAQAFEDAAKAGEQANEPRTANYWAQAGNAWAAAGEYDKARLALDAALAAGRLRGLDLGEVQLDRARVLVAEGDLPGARADLDQAVIHAADDPLVWLLSATLARRMGNVPLAQRHISEAVKRAKDDGSVQLEAGNIAALQGQTDEARTAWLEVMRIAPGTEQAAQARGALKQFGPGATPFPGGE